MMTLDHVVPRSQGGLDKWENLVCACPVCNNRKGDRTPEQAAMPLLRSPRKPSVRSFLFQNAGTVRTAWQLYLGTG